MAAKRIVVAGMGVISPVGLDVPTLWQNLIVGRLGISPITLFDTRNLGVRIAGEATRFDPTNYMSAKDARRAGRLTQSGLVINDHNAHDVGIIVGSGVRASGPTATSLICSAKR